MTVVANAEFAQSYMAQDQVWDLWVMVFLVSVLEKCQSSVKMVSRRTTTRWRGWPLFYSRVHRRDSVSSAVGSPLDYDAGSRSGIFSP